MSVILILGASSGIGRALAEHWAQRGESLILAARDLQDLEKTANDLRLRFGGQIAAMRFDALEFDSHAQFLDQCTRQFPAGLDGVMLCYGELIDQEAAANDFALAGRMIDINYASPVSILNLAANYFEPRKAGFICALSSVAGDRGRQSNCIYCSTKSALTAYLQGLRQRLSKSGVRVTTIKPGFVDTAMIWGSRRAFLVASPQRVAADVAKAIRKGKGEIYTPWFWWSIMSVVKAIPDRVFKKLKL